MAGSSCIVLLMNALLAKVVSAVVFSVGSAGPEGVPGGTIYAALMTQGCTLEQFTKLMSIITASGLLVKKGELYFLAPKLAKVA